MLRMLRPARCGSSEGGLAHRSFSGGGARPALVTALEPCRDARGNGIEDFEESEAAGSHNASTAEAFAKNVLQLGTELASEALRISQERRAVEKRRNVVESHRFDSGSSFRARAASTWSASLFASAFAV
jgi:hypothetical protein